MSQNSLWREVFWADVLSHILRNQSEFTLGPPPSVSHYSVVNLGREKINIHLYIGTHKNVSCQLVLQNEWRWDAFKQLERQRDAIEREVGSLLNWNSCGKIPRIILQKNINAENTNNRVEIRDWLLQNAVVFHRTFSGRVLELQQPSRVVETI